MAGAYKLEYKKPYKSGDAKIDRVTQAIYNDLNAVIKAMNNPQGEIARELGKKGDVRVNELGLQYNNGENWLTAAQDLPGQRPGSTALSVRTNTEDIATNLDKITALEAGPPLRWAAVVPTSSTSTGTKGQVYIDTANIYICVATNTWYKVSDTVFLTTWS